MDCPEGLMLDSYPGAIMQIMTNLIMNSLIHGFADGLPGEIFVSVEAAGDNVVLAYRDTGVGMDQEQKERIYDPFYTTTRGSGGTGLGMNIVYNLVTQTLKGSILLETSPGQGAIFILTLPRDPDRVVADSAA
jgi:signal transduction histidine kinase